MLRVAALLKETDTSAVAPMTRMVCASSTHQDRAEKRAFERAKLAHRPGQHIPLPPLKNNTTQIKD